jgi:uncharacterized protein involved in type VI secretion and phage assembly
LLGSCFVERQHAGAGLELYDYPGEFKEAAHSERYARLRLEALQAQHEIFRGEGDLRGICTGVRFTLQGHPGEKSDKEFLTTGVDYRIDSGSYTSDAALWRQFQHGQPSSRRRDGCGHGRADPHAVRPGHSRSGGARLCDRHQRQEACPACWWQMPVRLGRVIQFTTTGQFTTEVNQVC